VTPLCKLMVKWLVRSHIATEVSVPNGSDLYDDDGIFQWEVIKEPIV